MPLNDECRGEILLKDGDVPVFSVQIAEVETRMLLNDGSPLGLWREISASYVSQ